MTQRKIALECSVCGSRNYSVTTNEKRSTRLEVKKYCKHCGRHTLHRETR